MNEALADYEKIPSAVNAILQVAGGLGSSISV